MPIHQHSVRVAVALNGSITTDCTAHVSPTLRRFLIPLPGGTYPTSRRSFKPKPQKPKKEYFRLRRKWRRLAPYFSLWGTVSLLQAKRKRKKLKKEKNLKNKKKAGCSSNRQGRMFVMFRPSILSQFERMREK